ncbi:SsgA family sporulation/cell division regulator [Streptomyces sp. NPDC006923]|uniref:SsgA family sporulation/cell division regulator n=1 Tax=Streptomyces sp. NPDC006923 TaxID=3155355 RepID=UPI0033EE6C03
MPPIIEQSAKARLITDAPHHKAVSVTLRYDGADPLAMRIVFPPEVSLDHDEVIWAFARDLLESGLRLPSGHGDVQVWPCGRAQTILEFHSREGVAMVQFDSTPLHRFLKSSYSMVPAGEERHDIEVENELGKLLHRT